MMKACFGVDIGGTSVKLGLIRQDRALLEKREFPSPRDPSQMFREIGGTIKEIMEQLPEVEYVGAGVGVPGPVVEHSLVQGCVNLGWGDINVAQALSSLIGLPVLVENDANLAAMGELWHGAGLNHRNVTMLTIGTGIGCGVIVDGRIVSGAAGAAGEAGHLPMDCHMDRICSCGKAGCLEVTASATGIIRSAREFPPFCYQAVTTAKDVFDAAKAGNVNAAAVVAQAGECLGKAAAMLGCIVNPELFIIGGGVSAAGEMILAPIEAAYRKWVFSPCRGSRFVLAQLGNSAGIYGGAGLFLYKP